MVAGGARVAALGGLPDEVARELRRVVERWHQLPLDDALARMPAVRLLVQELADEVAVAEGRDVLTVPDLGPGVVMDQLAVVTYDAAVTPGIPDLAGRLAALRRAL